LCFGAPANCINSKNCKAAVAVTVSGEKYEFEMKATNNAAWVGVGLSEDEKMGDDSVIECAKKGSSVGAHMSWTSGSPNFGAARLNNVTVFVYAPFTIVNFVVLATIRYSTVEWKHNQ
jgi:hypothetical protein